MKDNLKPMTLDEQKKVMLDILKAFADFCDSNNLMYYLDAGTLIGAVRHKGYIPWDDDIDVNMPQKDYDKFVEMTRKADGFIAPHIRVEYPEETIYPFLKIFDDRTLLVEFPTKNPMEVGVYIDVFTKYGKKEKSWKSRWGCRMSGFIRDFHWFCRYSLIGWKKPYYGKVKHIVAYLLGPFLTNSSMFTRLQTKFMHWYLKSHPLEKCRYVTTLTNGEFHKLAPKECFDGYQMLEFEGCQFKGPKDYDTYLHCLYKGDYMQLPPEDKRVHHTIEVYWK